MVQLSRWGLLDDVLASGARAVRTVGFGTGGALLARTVKPTAGVDLLIAPRRHVLDSILRNAAVDAGATLYAPARVHEVVRHPAGRVTGLTIAAGRQRHTIEARFVIGADGLRSTVARDVRAETRIQSVSPSDTFYSYVAGLDTRSAVFDLLTNGTAIDIRVNGRS